jgi:large subunit ribosomal protein L27
MSHVKAGGSAKNVHDSPGQRLGVKIYGGQKVKAGDIIVRQIGQTKRPGKGTFIGRDFTIHAAQPGVVKFVQRRVKRFNGRTVPRTEVTVE